MDGWVDGWMGGWVDELMGVWMGGWMGGWVRGRGQQGWMDGWMDGVRAASMRVDGWMDGCEGGGRRELMGGWVGGRGSARVGGWMDGWMDGWIGRWEDGGQLGVTAVLVLTAESGVLCCRLDRVLEGVGLKTQRGHKNGLDCRHQSASGGTGHKVQHVTRPCGARHGAEKIMSKMMSMLPYIRAHPRWRRLWV